MKFHCKTFEPSDLTSDLLIIAKFNDRSFSPDLFPGEFGTRFSHVLSTLKFTQKDTDLFISLDHSAIKSVLLINLNPDDTLESAREAGYFINHALGKINSKHIHFIFDGITENLTGLVRSVSEGFLLAAYSFAEFKKDNKRENSVKSWTFLVESAVQVPQIRKTVGNTVHLIKAVNYSRTLSNLPSNVLTPGALAEKIKEHFSSHPQINVKVLQKKKIEALNMNAFLAVAQGSDAPPVLITMIYQSGKKKAKKLALVGKGITFDSGGISIKPSAKMEEMKYDMAGAATVAGVFHALADLRPDLDVVAVIPATENLPGGKAYKPGDIITAANGKTIEIINTDAEGRLILADALSYTEKKFRPDWILDFATLTGSVYAALGSECAGLFSNNDELSAKLRQAAEDSGEKIWPMPMWSRYHKQIESKVADIKNAGNGGAGSITAAKFLEAFIENTPWAHIDIAGTAYDLKSRNYLGEGASGYGVRLVMALIKNLGR